MLAFDGGVSIFCGGVPILRGGFGNSVSALLGGTPAGILLESLRDTIALPELISVLGTLTGTFVSASTSVSPAMASCAAAAAL